MPHPVSRLARLARIVVLQAVIATFLLPAVPAASVPITVEPDVTPPVVTSDARASYTASATITITATDAGSGVDHVSYNLDGAG